MKQMRRDPDADLRFLSEQFEIMRRSGRSRAFANQVLRSVMDSMLTEAFRTRPPAAFKGSGSRQGGSGANHDR